MAQAILVCDYAFGDAGKGATVDYETRQHANESTPVINIRYCGGAQAAHNVVDMSGKHHTFSQFGSGTFVSGTKTHLSRFMMVNPITMQAEERHLQTVGVHDAFERMTVERDALVTTPIHMSMNRLREMFRGGGRHGSCGMGIGETMSDSLEYGDTVLRVKDLENDRTLRRKLEWLQQIKWEDANQLYRAHHLMCQDNPDFQDEWRLLGGVDSNLVDTIMERFIAWREKVSIVGQDYLPGLMNGKDGTFIFEGAQGVLLDEDWGFHPYTTWTKTTFKNAEELIRGVDCETRKVAVLRGYHTRHGAGPFPTEDAMMTRLVQDEHNSSGHPYQQNFRVGPFDTVLLRYALRAAGPIDEVALTNLDRLSDKIRVCTAYARGYVHLKNLPPHEGSATPTLEYQSEVGRVISAMEPVYETFTDTESFLRHIEAEAGCPIRTCAYGPRATDRRVR